MEEVLFLISNRIIHITCFYTCLIAKQIYKFVPGAEMMIILVTILKIIFLITDVLFEIQAKGFG